jgi:hypothetical protein
LADLDAELEQFARGFAALPRAGWRRSSAESNPELRDPLMAVPIASAIAKTGGNLDDAIGPRWLA